MSRPISDVPNAEGISHDHFNWDNERTLETRGSYRFMGARSSGGSLIERNRRCDILSTQPFRFSKEFEVLVWLKMK